MCMSSKIRIIKNNLDISENLLPLLNADRGEKKNKTEVSRVLLKQAWHDEATSDKSGFFFVLAGVIAADTQEFIYFIIFFFCSVWLLVAWQEWNPTGCILNFKYVLIGSDFVTLCRAQNYFRLESCHILVGMDIK